MFTKSQQGTLSNYMKMLTVWSFLNTTSSATSVSSIESDNVIYFCVVISSSHLHQCSPEVATGVGDVSNHFHLDLIPQTHTSAVDRTMASVWWMCLHYGFNRHRHHHQYQKQQNSNGWNRIHTCPPQSSLAETVLRFTRRVNTVQFTS